MRQRDRAASGGALAAELSGELLESYTRAVYRVDSSPSPILLAVGAANPELDRWLAATGASCFAFLSAANPGSRPLSEAENEHRHRLLLERVRGRGLPVVGGESYEEESGGWREASLLIGGIERGAAIALAREFGQVALLYGELGGPVELVLTPVAAEES